MKIRDFFRNLFRRDKKKTVNLTFPTSWEAMTLPEFKQVCHILSLKGLSRERALFLCLCRLAGIRPDSPARYDPKKIKNLMPFIIDGRAHLIKASDVAAACEELSFIYDSVGLPPCPLPKVDRNIYDVSFGRFFEADSLIMRASVDKNQGPRWLKEAAKVLTNGAYRKLTDGERVGLVIWWNGVKDRLKAQFPYVFQEGGGITAKTQGEVLQDLLSCMNGNRPQENGLILNTEVHDVLYSLNRIYKDAYERAHK